MLKILTGSTLFFAIFRVLKYSKNIPVMCTVGATFSNVVTEILLFLVVIFALFLAFGVMFNILFATSMASFENLGHCTWRTLPLTECWRFRNIVADHV